jgi:hypothetical protein
LSKQYCPLSWPRDGHLRQLETSLWCISCQVVEYKERGWRLMDCGPPLDITKGSLDVSGGWCWQKDARRKEIQKNLAWTRHHWGWITLPGCCETLAFEDASRETKTISGLLGSMCSLSLRYISYLFLR